MNYDIKITGNNKDRGQIEFDRLSLLAKSTKEIAQKALMLKVFGFSDIELSAQFRRASEIRLEKLVSDEINGTAMLIDCNYFADSVKTFQFDAFKPELWGDLQQLTPMALVIKSFRAALIDSEDKDILDKSLLKSLIKFKKNFSGKKQVFHLSNRQSVPEIDIKIDDFKKIELLEENIPEPNKVTVLGTFDELKYSKQKVVLVTLDGTINATVRDEALFLQMLEYVGKELTITGMAHYKPTGKLSFIEINSFSEPGKTDKYFAKIPQALTVQQQIDFQLKERRALNPFASIIGKWPGEETWQEIINELD
jgi:anti-anti-sigma regulatory factor